MEDGLLVPMKSSYWIKSQRKLRRIEKRWTHLDVDRLIDLVEPRERIWNPKDAEYRNTKRRMQAFAEVAEHCGRSLADCKAKWDNLRAQFRSYDVNLRFKKKSEAKWRFYDRMMFLSSTRKEKPKQTTQLVNIDGGNNETSNTRSSNSLDAIFEQTPQRFREESTDIEPISNAMQSRCRQMDSHQIFADFLADRLRLLSANKAEELKNKMLKWVMGAIEIEARSTKNRS